MKHVLFFLLWGSMVGGAFAAEPVEDKSHESELPPDKVLQAFVESGRIQEVVAVAATEERVIHQGAFGPVGTDEQDQVKVDAIFKIASMTKPVTSIAVMQLVERGQLELNASIGTYLEELEQVQVLEGFDDSGMPLLRDAMRPPTIRELLSHTAGFAYPPWDERLHQYNQAAHILPVKQAPFPPLVSEPGTRWDYGPGTDILGPVVEEISGLNLEKYFRRYIFGPLDMQDTFYQVPEDKWDRVVRGFTREKDGSLVVDRREEPKEVTEFHGDRGLYSTGPDYLRLVRAFLNGGQLDGKRILKPETVELMSRNQIGELQVGKMTAVDPEFIFKDMHFFPEAVNKFGLGFLLNGDAVPAGRAAGSLMWAGAENTYFWIDQESGVGGVVMAQIMPFPDEVVLELLEAYEKAVYALVR